MSFQLKFRYPVTALLGLLIFGQNSFSQPKDTTIKPGYLQVFGAIKTDVSSIDGAIVSITHGDRVIQQDTTKSNGKFDIRLDLNGDYLMTVSKSGMITKKISISTKVPDSELPYEYSYKFNVKLFTKMDAVKTDSILSKPVARIMFYPLVKDFDYDTNYTKAIKTELIALKDTTHALEKLIAKANADSLAKWKTVIDSLKRDSLAKVTQKAYDDSVASAQKEEERKAQLQAELNRKLDEEARLRKIEMEKQRLAQSSKLDSALKAKDNEDRQRREELAAKANEELQKQKQAYIDSHAGSVSKIQAGPDDLPKFEKKDYPEGATMETYKEPNRTITREILKKNGQETIFIKIIYNWGGAFFFKDEKSMTESTYEQELRTGKDSLKK